MVYRIDPDSLGRYNQAGNRTTSVSAAQQRVFQQAIQEAITDRREAGGPAQFNPENEQVAVVEAGDTPEGIASKFNVSLEDLRSANRGIFGGANPLEVNEVVFLPPKDPVLVAQGPRNRQGVPAGEEAFRSDIYDRANELQYDDNATLGDRDRLRAELRQDVKTYLDALPAAERQAAAERLLGDEADWQDATVGREAIKAGQDDSFAGELYLKGNRVEYAEPGVDTTAATAGIANDVKTYIESLPPEERTARLQALYDHDWRDAGPAQIAIEDAAEDMGITLRETTHAGPEVESQARTVIDRAKQAGSPDEVKQAYDRLYAEQPAEVRQALDINLEAQQLLRDATQQGKIDAMMEEWDPQDFHNEEMMAALRGENPDLGQLSEAGKVHLIDKYVDLYCDLNDAGNMPPMISSLIDFARFDADPATRDLIVSRLAHKALEFNQNPMEGDPVYLANAAMRAASGDLYTGTELSAEDTDSLKALINGMQPEELASFIGLFGDRDMLSHPGNNTTEVKARLLATILEMPPSPTVSAGVQALFAGANDAMPPESLEQLATAIAREWYPGDPARQSQEAERLSGILATDQGKALLLQKYMPDQGDVSLNARVQALLQIRGDAGIDAKTLQQTDDPWQNPVFTDPIAQEAATPYLTLRGDAPIVHSGTDLDNMVGTAMGAQPVLPEGTSPDDVQAQVVAGTLSLFQGEQNEHVQTVANAIREYGGDNAAVTVLPILYSSAETGTVSLPLFRIDTPEGARFVDNLGRKYDSFDQWKAENKLPPGSMTYPTDGHLTQNADGSVRLSAPEATPETVDTFGEHVTGILDKAALVGGIVLAGAVIIGSGGTATPLVAAGGVAVASWGAYRTGTELADRAEHGQSINPLDNSEARMLWLNGVASVAGVGAFASAGKLASLAAKGAPLTPAMARVIGATQAISNTADAAAIVNMGHYSVANWNRLSGEERMSAILSMGFWGATMGMNASRGPGLSPRTIPDMFNPEAQIRNLNAAYTPRVVDDPSLPGNEIHIVDDPATGGFTIRTGPTASEADIANHVHVARLMYQNNGLSGQMKSLFGAETYKPGTKAYRIRFEAEKLGPKLQQLSDDLQNPNLTEAQRAQIQAEIDDYGYFLAGLQRAATDPNVDANAIRQPATGKEIASTDGPSGTGQGSSQEALESYCRANGLNPQDYVWYRRPGANGQPDTAALRRASGSTTAPELEVRVGPNGHRTIVPKPPTTTPSSNGRIGDAAENHAIETFKQRGYTTILTVKNPSGHGVDLFMYNPTTKQYVVAEIKANSSQLSPDQRLGPTYALDRMTRAAEGQGSWSSASPADKLRAEVALREMLPGEARPDIHYLVIRYDVDPGTLEVSNPRHVSWGAQEGISTGGDLFSLDGPPEFPVNPDWLSGDGVP
ncbi:LysM domain-containing protein [Mesorhizobium sp. J18]|uniref:DUF4781 domain-containing protein n=1 Tax=Mesorhizobium sp. J18 TaxID=935263 RepID=UPI00119B82C8|nr:DUF4781 domain-containing protein [Mesorhizobium sp. J18]TWG94948.1 LysM domain-containing protein [Mesorhizobium sp. J18]